MYHVLGMKDEYVEDFADALMNLKNNFYYCEKCGHLTDGKICDICEDETRDQTIVMVVEKPQDVYAMEKI